VLEQWLVLGDELPAIFDGGGIDEPAMRGEMLTVRRWRLRSSSHTGRDTTIRSRRARIASSNHEMAERASSSAPVEKASCASTEPFGFGRAPLHDVRVEQQHHSRSQARPVEKSSSSSPFVIATPDWLPLRELALAAGIILASVRWERFYYPLRAQGSRNGRGHRL